MAYLTSSSTDAQVWAAYEDNSAYDLESDATKAREFVQACRILLRRQPRRAGHGGADLEFDVQLFRDELNTARRWLHTQTTITDGGIGCKFADISDIRS